MTTKGPKLLAGGNPQISKGYGDGPVQAYIDAMPEWKKDIGLWIDKTIIEVFPRVQKAVKWNSPFYGGADGWFLSFHCFTKYVKVTFFKGALLEPMPPDASKQEQVRYWNIYEGDDLNGERLKAWIKQAQNLPGEKL
jgi:hypothetical protein